MTAPTTAAPLSGQDISITANATRAVFDQLLAEAGTEFDSWVVLRQLAMAGGELPRVDLAGRLASLLKLDAATTSLLLRRLTARDWLTSGDPVALSTPGAAFHEGLTARSAELTAELYRGLDPADLATAKRVLDEVSRRATAYIGQ